MRSGARGRMRRPRAIVTPATAAPSPPAVLKGLGFVVYNLVAATVLLEAVIVVMLHVAAGGRRVAPAASPPASSRSTGTSTDR